MVLNPAVRNAWLSHSRQMPARGRILDAVQRDHQATQARGPEKPQEYPRA